MKNVFEELTYYCLGLKGHNHNYKHGKLKENKNITLVQNWLSNNINYNEDLYYNISKELFNYNRGDKLK